MVKYIMLLQISAPTKVNNNFELKGFIEVNFKVNLNSKKNIKRLVITVATATPYKLNLGIRIKFKITLIIVPEKTAQKIFFCWFETIKAWLKG